MVQNNVSGAPGRGRPRKFDTDTVMRRARDTFWRHGYAGTSMDQLAAATGLHKPSLYGAFGDKRQLYLEALNRYLREAWAALDLALREPDLWQGLNMLTEGEIALYTRDPDAAGCFMLSTALPVAGGDDEILAIVRSAMEAFDELLEQRFERAIAAGDIPADADVPGLVRLLATSHNDLSVRARAGYAPEQLRAMAAETVRLAKRLAGQV